MLVFDEPKTKKFCAEDIKDIETEKWQKNILGLSGLCYKRNFISEEEENELLQSVYKNEWSSVLKRRVQHFGYKYNYKSRLLGKEDKIGELPDWISPIVEKLQSTPHPLIPNSSSFWDKKPDQLIVNEYLPGQGISPHIDSKLIFGDTIISISLGSSVGMEFTPPKSLEPNSKKVVALERRSALLLFGDARYLWKHSIPARKSDKNLINLNNQKNQPCCNIQRDRRVSLTLRQTILGD